MSLRIDDEKMNYFNSLDNNEISSNFGNWINNLDSLKEQYSNGDPFEHIIIDNFLNSSIAEEICELYPDDLKSYHLYNNPIEVKYAHDDISSLDPKIERIFYLLSTTIMENVFSILTGIILEKDPYLHGAGLHLHPRNGRLGIHLDYEIHPISGKQRKLNIILYLSKEWNNEWNGHSELWNSDHSKCIVKSPVNFNSALIFKTNEISWHGVSKKIECPIGLYRKTLAFYYISDKTDLSDQYKIGCDETGYRKKATFVCRPDEKNKDKIEPFLEIRPYRRITEDDVERIWPGWNSEEY